jgi:DNA repair exonuclease SbcCD ATPase subunit
VSDPEVAPSHCQVYPAQGNYWLQDLGAGQTFLNMQRLGGETDGLNVNDVFIMGRTFVRFLETAPASGGAGSSMGSSMGSAVAGVDPSAFDAQQREIESLKEEVERLRDHGRKGEDLTDTLGDKLSDAKEKFEKARRQITERDDEILELRKERGRNEAKITNLEQEVANTQKDKQKESDDFRKELDRRNEQIREFKAEAKGRDDELNQVRREQATSRVDAKRLKLELGMLEKESKKSLDSSKNEASERIDSLRTTLETSLVALEAAHATLESLGVQRPASDLPSGKTSELSKALTALGLPDAKLETLRKALAAHVDQEALRRYSGPHLNWERPESALAREAQLHALRTRGEHVELQLNVAAEAAQ